MCCKEVSTCVNYLIIMFNYIVYISRLILIFIFGFDNIIFDCVLTSIFHISIIFCFNCTLLKITRAIQDGSDDIRFCRFSNMKRKKAS